MHTEVDVEMIRKKVYGWCLIHARNTDPSYEEIVKHQQTKCPWCRQQVENMVRNSLRHPQ